MTMIAYAFLQARRLKQAEGGKKNPRTAASTKPARRPPGDPLDNRPEISRPMSPLPQATAS
jgi:SRSO17 transposase